VFRDLSRDVPSAAALQISERQWRSPPRPIRSLEAHRGQDMADRHTCLAPRMRVASALPGDTRPGPRPSARWLLDRRQPILLAQDRNAAGGAAVGEVQRVMLLFDEHYLIVLISPTKV